MRQVLSVFLTSLVCFSSVQVCSQEWPSFRGPNATGIAEGKHPPTTWNLKEPKNVKWKTAIPGLAHSSPIIWGDRLFITSAVDSKNKSTFELATSGRAVTDDSTKLQWKMYALEKKSGKIIWERTACQGLPRTKRHRKSSQCNSTPATDGRYVAAIMGSEGLYCFDVNGNLLWQKDLGVLDGGYVGKPEFQWGHASSPIIYKNMVIVQIDKFKGSYLAAYDVKIGTKIWSVARSDLPTWCTPTVFEGSNRVELITNGGNYARGYDPMTGKELWRLADHAEVKVPTPIVANGLIYLSGGAPRGRGMIAIKTGAKGDIPMKNVGDSNSLVTWQIKKSGPYTITPIVYGDRFYSCSDNGILSCYDSNTGKSIYRTRLGGGFSASPVAAGGKLYFASESGIVHVVKAGSVFTRLAKNDMGEGCMATPAISDGMIFMKHATQHLCFGQLRIREWIIASAIVILTTTSRFAGVARIGSDIHWTVWVVAGLVLINGGWMAFDGGRAMIVGEYVTPKKGVKAGSLGPRAKIAEGTGIDPRSTFMNPCFSFMGFRTWLPRCVLDSNFPCVVGRFGIGCCRALVHSIRHFD